MRVLLPLFLCHLCRFMLRQAPSDRPCLLRAQVQRLVLLGLVEDAQLRALVGVYDCQDTGDGFAKVMSMA